MVEVKATSVYSKSSCLEICWNDNDDEDSDESSSAPLLLKSVARDTLEDMN